MQGRCVIDPMANFHKREPRVLMGRRGFTAGWSTMGQHKALTPTFLRYSSCSTAKSMLCGPAQNGHGLARVYGVSRCHRS